MLGEDAKRRVWSGGAADADMRRRANDLCSGLEAAEQIWSAHWAFTAAGKAVELKRGQAAAPRISINGEDFRLRHPQPVEAEQLPPKRQRVPPKKYSHGE